MTHICSAMQSICSSLKLIGDCSSLQASMNFHATWPGPNAKSSSATVWHLGWSLSVLRRSIAFQSSALNSCGASVCVVSAFVWLRNMISTAAWCFAASSLLWGAVAMHVVGDVLLSGIRGRFWLFAAYRNSGYFSICVSASLCRPGAQARSISSLRAIIWRQRFRSM